MPIRKKIYPNIEFYSSVGGAAFLEGLINEWTSQGWEVTRCHALSESEYRRALSPAGRWWLRWKMYGLYAWSAWKKARQTSAFEPIRVVTTNPFFAPALVQRADKGRGPTINLLYDLYPDALIRAGTLRENGWAARQCAGVTRLALRDCAATVFLGERLRRHAEARYGPARRAVVIPVGADGAPFRETPPQLLPAMSTLTVLYAGQMGRMHEIETLAGLLKSGVPEGTEFSFHATGAGYGSLKRRFAVTGLNCRWGSSLDDAAWRRALLDSPIALVTMAAGAQNIVMPSKSYAAMVAGQALMAVCPADSDLADLVRAHDCGWVIEPGDTSRLRACLTEARSQPAILLNKRRNAFEAGHRFYDQAALARRWEELFHELLQRHPRTTDLV